MGESEHAGHVGGAADGLGSRRGLLLREAKPVSVTYAEQVSSDDVGAGRIAVGGDVVCALGIALAIRAVDEFSYIDHAVTSIGCDSFVL